VATGKASKVLRNGQMLTVDCSSGLKGNVYSGKVLFETKEYNLKEISSLPARNASIIADAGGPVKIMVNIGEPGVAFKTSFLPVDGVGLAREEFIIAEKIRVHPLALYDYEKLKRSIRNSSSVILSQQAKNPGQEILRPDGLRMTSSIKAKVQKIIKEIDEITIEHQDKKEFFVKELAEGVGQVAAAFWPKPVILRFSDFKTNEYRALVGGELYEPLEENPMIGWRGASRYYDEKFKPAFLMECEAIKRVRDVFGLKNLKLMIPFCRTVEEGKKVLEIMRQAGLERGQDGLEVFVMCEIPSNVIMAEQFLEIFDGMSIGSNDLTQLTLGLDRDNGGLAYIGNENNEAVKELLKKVIKVCREKGKYCGICGDAPSSFPDFANFLMDCGIESISLSPDAVIKTILQLSREKGQTPPL